ncbi:MAG: hypothetical protein ACOZAL_00860 [Patescibacteria group bacterium]
MAKFFRIKNKVVRFLAGLVVAAFNGLFSLAKYVLFVCLFYGGVTGLGFGVRFLSIKIGFPSTETLTQWSKSAEQGSALWAVCERMFLIGFISIFATAFLIAVMFAVVAAPIKIYEKAKEAGDKYFNRVGDK